MNYGIVRRVLGDILIVESLLMIPSMLIAFYTGGNDINAFVIAIIITSIVGFFMRRNKHGKLINSSDGLAIVAFGWLLASIFGALPLFLSGTTNYLDALFETVSGFTTTGATVISNVEALPQGLLFWRSFTHWIGGMGILVFTIALIPALGIGGFQIFKAESPGPVAGKIAPRIKDTAKILYALYFGMTILQIIMLRIGGMNLFDSMVYTFGTVGTGGFATKNNSVAFYNSSYIHLVIATFMIMAGTNFTIYYSILKRKFKDAFLDEELRLYLTIVVVSVVAIAANLYLTNYNNLALSLRDSYFQVSSVMTTTGYTTADFDLWPSFSKGILLLLMFIGASAGSTAGGLKVIRILILFKLIRREISKIFHPRAVIPIKANDRIVRSDTVASINSFVALYFVIFVISTLLVTLEGVNLESAASSVVATLSNIGPGLGFVGPTQNFGAFRNPTKILFTFLMLLGRLELFTIIALLAPKNWRREYR